MNYNNEINNANKIINNLWLGDAVSALSKSFHTKENITVVINCSKTIKFDNDIKYKYRIPVDDNLQPSELIAMVKYIKKIIPVIKTHLDKGRTILIHCAAGMQRSAIVVLSYL